MQIEYTFTLRISSDQENKNLAIHEAGMAWAGIAEKLSEISPDIEMVNVKAVSE